jgi:hypothetical protein
MATEIDQLTTEIATLESQISAITAAAVQAREAMLAATRESVLMTIAIERSMLPLDDIAPRYAATTALDARGHYDALHAQQLHLSNVLATKRSELAEQRRYAWVQAHRPELFTDVAEAHKRFEGLRFGSGAPTATHEAGKWLEACRQELKNALAGVPQAQLEPVSI